MPRLAVLLAVLALAACGDRPEVDVASESTEADIGASPAAVAIEERIARVEAQGGTVRRAAFVAIDGVYNSELVAPYDVFHHTVFRDSLDYIEPFVVSPDGEPVTTFEGLTVAAHYAYDTAPPADIVVIPSAEHSMDRDLENDAYMEYLAAAVAEAEWVVAVCDGAFPLAKTGALDGRVATTFPADREALALLFPAVDVRDDVRLVVDGPYITSVGGGMSYEPAFWLVERLWGPERVAGNAEGLAWDWTPEAVPHLVVERREAGDAS
ncbi:MAG: DJ-1/PfpI family protein [Bacteroidota bacterium]